MIKIYGPVYGRTRYVRWTIEELGLEYENINVDFMKGEGRSPEHLAINPNGKVPAIDDDGFILWESAAINMYLARKYGDGILWTTNLEEEAHIYQWCLFAITEVDKHSVEIAIYLKLFPESPDAEERVSVASGELHAPHKVLDDYLKDREYLVAGRFTVADIGVATALSFAVDCGQSIDKYPALKKWYDRCTDREAYQS